MINIRGKLSKSLENKNALCFKNRGGGGDQMSVNCLGLKKKKRITVIYL